MNKSVCHSSPYSKIWIITAVILGIVLLFTPVMKLIYPVRYKAEILKYSAMYNLDKHLVMAIISAESEFKKNATSHKGAKGLMQLKEKTAKWCMEQFNIEGSIENIYSPDLNINIGCAYIDYLNDKFGNNTNTVLAAYNAGEGNVSKWLKDSENYTLPNIPFEETRNYVDTVNNRVKIYKFLY